jgi:Ca2+/Na+ antiporter
MKRFVFIWIGLVVGFIALQAQQSVSSDTVAVTSTDTVVSTWTDTPAESPAGVSDDNYVDADISFDKLEELLGWTGGWIAFVSIFAIVCIFLFPFFVLYLIFSYRYRQRRERYRLWEKAIDSGQPLPEDFVKKASVPMNERAQSERNKGLQTLFTGIAVYVLFWLFFDSLKFASVGIFLMIIGIGQLVIALVNDRDRQSNDSNKK